MSSISVPGVYTLEDSTFPPSVATVQTAIPAFIGYTETATINGRPWDFGTYQSPTATTYFPAPGVLIYSFLDFQNYFGGVNKPTIAPGGIVVDPTTQTVISTDIDYTFFLYDSVRLFYANGGGACYIFSTGTWSLTGTNTSTNIIEDASSFDPGHFIASINQQVVLQDEVTIILYPDGVSLDPVTPVTPPALPALPTYQALSTVNSAALAQCGSLMSRVAILDIEQGDELGTSFRTNGVGM